MRLFSLGNFILRSEGCQSGFTLAELLIAVAMIGTLSAMAVPSLKSMAERQEIHGQARQIAASLLWARLEAVRKRGVVRLSFIDTGEDMPGGAYSIWLDVNDNGVKDVADGDVDLRLVQISNTVSVDNANDLLFNSLGMGKTGSILLSNSSGLKKKVSVSKAGNVSVSTVTESCDES